MRSSKNKKSNFKEGNLTKRLIFAAVVCLLAGACGPGMTDRPPAATSPEANVYLSRVMAAPLTFTVPKDKSDEAWARVNSFIAKYSTMKIQTASEYIIETYNPIDNFHAYGYTANRMTKGNEVEISVTGTWYWGQKKTATRNAHILALYAVTGELDESLISR
jgi:hypothetical protein